MSKEATRELCVQMIEQQDRAAAQAEARRDAEARADAARQLLEAAVSEGGGALRVDDTRVLRMQASSSRRAPQAEHVREAVGAAHPSDIQAGSVADSDVARLAESVFGRLKPIIFPRVYRLALTTSCPRGTRRDDLTPLPSQHAATLSAFEAASATASAARKRARSTVEADRCNAELLAQLSAAGGSLSYGLTVNGERRKAVLCTEPTKSCELLVSEVRDVVDTVTHQLFGDMDSSDLEAAWSGGNAQEQLVTALMDELSARRALKRSSTPRRVALRSVK